MCVGGQPAAVSRETLGEDRRGSGMAENHAGRSALVQSMIETLTTGTSASAMDLCLPGAWGRAGASGLRWLGPQGPGHWLPCSTGWFP